MISLVRPSPESIARFLEGQRSRELSHPQAGVTLSGGTLPGFTVDHTRGRLGLGQGTFEAACAALRSWRQFDLGWVFAGPPTTPIRSGEVIGVCGRALGLYWLNCCRIIGTIDEQEPNCRFGFAYGTLPGHVECGEERFLVEWNRATDEVWYDILACSRPRHWTARLGYPFVRRQQKRFGRDSVAAMQRAVAPTSNHSA